MIDVPAIVRKKAIVAGAEGWLDDLPGLVADLEREWAIEIGRSFPGGTEAFVAEADCADGTRAVLKLLVPRGDQAEREITVLRLTAGKGCVALLRADVPRGAMLLERLGRSLYDLSVPVGERHDILCATAARVWRPAPEAALPTGAEKGRLLAAYIVRMWETLDRPCSKRTIDQTLACAQRRVAAHDDERAVLVHGDVHQWNALEADRGFKLVDPDGLLAEAEYDLGIIMREDPVELRQGDPRARSWKLAALTGLDETAIWEWGVVERVSTGLLGTQIGMQPHARDMLVTADALSDLD